ADGEGEAGDDERDGYGRARPVEQPGEHVAAEIVEAQPVFGAWRRPDIADRRGFAVRGYDRRKHGPQEIDRDDRQADQRRNGEAMAEETHGPLSAGAAVADC